MKYIYFLLTVFITTVSWAQSGGNSLLIDISGNNNSIDLRQKNLGNVIGHYAEIDLIGNYNSINVRQMGSGTMNLDMTITGDNHSVYLTQKNQANHSATVTLINSGGAINFNLVQQGSIANQINFYQSCANPSGCTASVIQTGQ